VKVIDFGLCADLTDHGEDSLLNDKSGTVGYLAPELIAMTKQTGFYNSKVDVFSVGIVF
jgi:serine/threonine protein kinase